MKTKACKYVLETMTKEERSLLLYLESRCVDNDGDVDTRKMNKDDMVLAVRWHGHGFIEWSRFKFNDIPGPGLTHRVSLSDDAWALAHAERRARAARTSQRQEPQP